MVKGAALRSLSRRGSQVQILAHALLPIVGSVSVLASFAAPLWWLTITDEVTYIGGVKVLQRDVEFGFLGGPDTGGESYASNAWLVFLPSAFLASSAFGFEVAFAIIQNVSRLRGRWGRVSSHFPLLGFGLLLASTLLVVAVFPGALGANGFARFFIYPGMTQSEVAQAVASFQGFWGSFEMSSSGFSAAWGAGVGWYAMVTGTVAYLFAALLHRMDLPGSPPPVPPSL